MNTIITFFSEISQQTLKIDEKRHNYSNLAQTQIRFYIHQWPMVPHYGTQYEEHPASHHGGMEGHKKGNGHFYDESTIFRKLTQSYYYRSSKQIDYQLLGRIS